MMTRSAGILPSALERRGRRGFTGTLRVEGSPGGTVTMRGGLIVAASTPAAPGPEPLLLRSGRISEADWTAAFTAGAPGGRLGDELVRRGLLGDAGLQVVTRTAIVDAVFAMALGGVRTCTAVPDGPGEDGEDVPPVLLPADPGLPADRVGREVERRLAALEAWSLLPLTAPLSARSRPRATAAARDAAAGGGRRAVLDRADGRRTPRDIAFALGRGLFSVLGDLATLYEDGLVEEGLAEERAPAPPPVPAPRPVPPDVPSGPHGSFGAPGELPRRRRRPSG
ncbi:hypothetical protein [Actinomadura algeriensis]|uniref:DUF4388 domain-containing protein n=1 Tax=Actinomadura algeriensis TaxID=1679523 RepID=A0ABR9K2W9_9ACTN|nr:hypothetical protein [Actinomadura algeriensis]MBE1537199.1 hypothetical protein [Actinomadura algeriensis]